MPIDPLLLARLRERGMADTRIRHLHDIVERGSQEMRKAAIHHMSDIVDGPVRHYTREEGLTAELVLDHGMHWTGRALRLAAPRTLPATALAALPGQRLSTVVDFPGARDHVITGAEVDASGNTWIAVDATKVAPPASGTPLERALDRFALMADDWRRSDTRLACHGGYGGALVAGLILMAGLPVVWMAMFKTPLTGIGLGVALLAIVAFTFTLPWPEEWADAGERHLRDMKKLQTEQGW